MDCDENGHNKKEVLGSAHSSATGSLLQFSDTILTSDTNVIK